MHLQTRWSGASVMFVKLIVQMMLRRKAMAQHVGHSRIGNESCRWKRMLRLLGDKGIVKMTGRSQLSLRLSGERRWFQRLRGFPTRKLSENAERFAQSTDPVKNESTG